MSASKAVSRRALIKTMGAGGAVATYGIGARAQDYRPQAQTQVSKAAAHYQDQPRGSESCGSCPYFIVPNKCVPVEGDISPNGWCPMYTTFSPLDRGAHQAGQPGGK